MDYKKIYDEIIGNANFQNRIKHAGEYYERHHIIPKCLDNKVKCCKNYIFEYED